MENDRRSTRSIIHLDMDAFYASVEMLDDPSLKGKPVIVGGSKERGVVSAASYEARAFGVHSALPMATAMRLCPKGVFLPVRMKRYQEVSAQVFEIFHRFTPYVEPLSIDEAFLDVTGSATLFGSPVEIARKIKQFVRSETGLTVSAGVAPNKFLAKIASDLDKPDGLTVVKPGEEQAFLHPLPISKLWGVGKVTQKALEVFNVRTIGDLSKIPKDVLAGRFGKSGGQLHRLSLGIDDRDVDITREIKSVGQEETFRKDLIDREEIRREVLALSVKAAKRMRKKGFAGKTLTLKVKYHDFKQITRSMTFPERVCDGMAIFKHAMALLEKTEAGNRPVRLIGVSLSHLDALESPKQLSLFVEESVDTKSKKLNEAIDRIHDKFGDDALVPGTLLE